jgi:prepilin-type N-terminal cleavage/methylation domain-containing protein
MLLGTGRNKILDLCRNLSDWLGKFTSEPVMNRSLPLAPSPSVPVAFRRRDNRAFTLMELLVVVAILAIVGGLVVVAYEGLVGQAAKSTSSNSIAALGDAVRAYQVMERRLPDDLETLLAVGVSTSATRHDALLGDNLASSYNPGSPPIVSAVVSPQLAARLEPYRLTPMQRTNLLAAGIGALRYLDARGEGAGGRLDLRASGGEPASVGPIERIDIPAHAFDSPMPVPGSNRGRGFSLRLRELPAPFLPHLARWLPGPGGYDNQKLGATPGATLVVLGVGKNCSLVSAAGDSEGVTSKVRLASAPFYGDLGKAEYPNYLLVVDLDANPARFVTVIDPTGGFHAENVAGGRGQ